MLVDQPKPCEGAVDKPEPIQSHSSGPVTRSEAVLEAKDKQLKAMGRKTNRETPQENSNI